MGGIIGHELGNAHNRDVATLAGIVIGSAIAHNTSTVIYGAEQHRADQRTYCREHVNIFERQQLIGYKVKYKYRGNVFTTRTQYHPGTRIEIQHGTRHNRRFDY